MGALVVAQKYLAHQPFGAAGARFSAATGCVGYGREIFQAGLRSGMSAMRQTVAPLLCAAAMAAATSAQAAPASGEHVRVALVAEQTALVPGERSWVGLRLRHEPHWHTYWANPGDSGLPTKLTWHLPANIEAGEIAWPAPQRFEVGGLYNFGYTGEIVLPVPIQAGAGAKPGANARLTVEAHWLACREECVPGKKTLTLTLPIAASARADPRVRKAFAAAHAAQPVASTWTGGARLDGDQVVVALSGGGLPSAESLDAFVVQPQVVGYAPPKVVGRGDSLSLTFDRSEYLAAAPATLDLVLLDGKAPNRHARSVTLPFAAASPSAKP
jgi:thiol:disulfide interchange protein DsbD